MLFFFGFSISMVMLATIYSENRGREIEDADVPFLQARSEWADSVLRQMSLEEKVGQLLAVVADPDTTGGQLPITHWLREYHAGSIIFNNYSYEQQYKRTLLYQSYAALPLLVGMYSDAQNDQFVEFPDDWSLAAVREDTLIGKLGKEVAHQSAQLGNQLYILPYRQHRSATVGKVLKVTSRMQEETVLACARFEYTHPFSKTSEQSRDSLWAPYKAMARSGISVLMLNPNLIVEDTVVSIAQNFSIKDYLHNHIGFKGLLVAELADSMDLTLYLTKLMRAGVDMVILRKDVDKACRTLIKLVKGNYLSEADINQKVRKILMAKAWSGAVDFHAEARREQLAERPPAAAPTLLSRRLTEAAITLVKDPQRQLPFQHLAGRRMYVLNVGGKLPEFNTYLGYYTSIHGQEVAISRKEGLTFRNKGELPLFNTLVMALNNIPLDTLMSGKVIEDLRQLKERHQVVVVNFGAPEVLAYFADFPVLVQAYNNRPLTQEVAAQLLFGGVGAQGRLPLKVGRQFAAGTGIQTQPTRLAYTIPEAVNISSVDLQQIDSIVKEGISEFAMPGCQVLVAKDGKVIYHKAFGHHTYSRRQRVRETDLYDLASITKVAATTLASMKMYETGKLGLDNLLGEYFKDKRILVDSLDMHEVRYTADTLLYEEYAAIYGELESGELDLIESGEVPRMNMERKAVRYQDSLVIVYHPTTLTLSNESNIFQVSIRELLTHHSGLDASLNIYPYMYYKGQQTSPFGVYFDRTPNGDYKVQVAGDFYMDRHQLDALWRDTRYLRLNENRNYKYSDINMILLHQAIDSINQYSMERYLDTQFYRPLGLQTLRYNPRRSVISSRLIPTEYDHKWRKQLLKGYVHDPTAALMGGVAGSAGLFSNANDLAIIFQMLLNGGNYGGEQLLEEETIRLFTQRHLGHRGLGFDKPPLRGRYPIASTASPNSYGHTGFTGTCVWADPDEDLVFVFLSNRIHPTANNRRLIDMRIRERIHEVVYDAIAQSRQYASLEGRITAR